MEGASGVALAPLGPLIEGVLEADDLGEVLLLDGVSVGFVGTVEHHRPHPVGEQGGVNPAQVGAVADADVAELLVTQAGTDHVHVAGRVGGAVEAQGVAVVRRAAVGEGALVLVEQRLFLGVVGRVVEIEVSVHERVVDAFDTATAVDAPGVEADDVEVVEAELGLDDGSALGDRVEARGAGAAGVEQDRTFAVDGGRGAHEGDVDGGACKIVVVERHGQYGALEHRVVGRLVGARAPLDRVDVWRRWTGAGHSAGRPEAGRPHPGVRAACRYGEHSCSRYQHCPVPSPHEGEP